MKSTQICAFAACACMAFGAFADAANTLITFSTPGPDTYADGATVVDGEIYALVWTANETFGGFDANGNAAVDGDKVIFKAPLAKDGHCGLTLFQIDSKVAPQGGEYAVYLLDTRATTGDNLIVTGAAVAKTYKGTNGTANIASVKTDATTEGGIQSGTAALARDVKAIMPVIKGIKIDGAQVTISVGNLVPGLKYSVMGGLKRDTVVESVGFQDAKEANIIINSEEKFFSIKAE